MNSQNWDEADSEAGTCSEQRQAQCVPPIVVTNADTNTPWKNSRQGRVLSVMEIRDVLAHNLKTHRVAQGLSQEELAHRAGVDRTYISSLERSVYAAGIDVVDRLAQVLGMEAADLLKRPQAAKAGPKD